MMIKNYAIMDASGVFPVSLGANFTLPEGAVEIAFEAFDYASCMLVDGLWEDRPAASPPLVNGDVVTFTGLPAGTTITVRDNETSTVLAVTQEVEFQLPDPGDYSITVAPPLPWLMWEGRIQC